MNRKFSVKKITEKEYEDASIYFSIDLPMGPYGKITSIQLDYTCERCGGYGCSHGNTCHTHDTIEPINLKHSIGEEQTSLLIRYLQDFISNIT